MLGIVSAFVTILLIGLSTGGLLVSRRIDPHQSLFIVVGLAFFLFSYIGMFFGSKMVGLIGSSGLSIIFGLFCFAFIGFLIWKYDPAFGYVKQEPVTLTMFGVFFFLVGMELAVLDVTLWLLILLAIIFAAGAFLGFMAVYQIIFRHRSSQLLALLPLVPLLFIGLFKLI
ncbi:hypothetical protein BKP35_03645 [Anaerobacillus arseniciselenatis]|uniref:Uncharacterized protein n=1 Tax=Anaerobacillus arseniciselenatis TaxID=85682 RepID=A0A1S2LXH2_9BACI|nr:hypothetical protein [Anaerobacillus arseniciselenatis]OIJ16085.1 hypothetical protein BKP35_03645 [Anaerobacillus arseniciselenatis]